MREIPNPYVRTLATVREAPTTLSGSLKYLGPGFVLSASIVGSGELIATTQLGAKAGFVALWVILLSCLVKVTVQLEFGKQAIRTGEPTFAAFNRLPGPRLGNAHWSIWTWLFLMLFKFLQVGAIVGLVAVLLHICFPAVSGTVWTLVVAVVVASIVSSGYYRLIERLSLVMIGVFTLFTVVSLVALQFTDRAIGVGDVLAGLSFHIPEGTGMLLVLIGAFGITGVGGDEIMAYNYWLIEKGYASYTGPREDSEAWRRRARGWTRVMYADAVASMLVYTVVTAAFYLLGAAVLHGQAEAPTDGPKYLEFLAAMYTTTLGDWARPAFYLGAFVVLFSTAFAALGAWTRQFSDAFGRVGLLDFEDAVQRRRWIAALSWIIPFLWAGVWIFLSESLKGAAAMVLMGGFVTSIMLLIVLHAAIYFKGHEVEPALRPGKTYNVLFWTSAAAILVAGIYAVASPFLK